jgi:hypothetical protein
MACATLIVTVRYWQGGRRASVAVARAAAAALLVLSFAACYSPTLPLPPPDSPESAVVSADGMSVALDGTGVFPGAQVFAYNTDLGEGVITTATSSGRYHAVVPVDFSQLRRNTLEIWQRVGTQDSSSIALYCDRIGCQ